MAERRPNLAPRVSLLPVPWRRGWAVWYDGLNLMTTKPITILELHYPMIKCLTKKNYMLRFTPFGNNCFVAFLSCVSWTNFIRFRTLCEIQLKLRIEWDHRLLGYSRRSAEFLRCSSGAASSEIGGFLYWQAGHITVAQSKCSKQNLPVFGK